MLIRLEALELAANAGDSDASDRYALNVIQVRADGSVVVTDGTQLLRIQAAVNEPGLFDALLPALERGYEGDVLIEAGDAKDFKAACRKALKKAGKKSVQDGGEPVHVVVALNDDTMTMATADGIVERRFVIKQPADLKYPNVERVIPSPDREQQEITVAVDLMIKMLKTLKRLGVPSVTLGITSDPTQSISLRAKALAGDIDGALMPMRVDVDGKDTKPVERVDTTTGEVVTVQ